MEMEEYVKQIREKADSYERTIQTIIAFNSAIRWDDAHKKYLKNSYFLPGRRLSKNLTKPDGNVTPDIVIQLSDNYGIIAEVKITASSDEDFTKAYEQIQNYDTDLIGWKTNNKKIDLHDLSLLVNDLKRNIAKRYFKDKTFQKKFTLIACARISESKEFWKIEKYYGFFSNQRVENKLRDPVPIPLEAIIKDVSSVKFYDAEPPVEYIMNVLWMSIFNEIKQKEEKETGKMISVDCKEITKMAKERYSFGQLDRRQPETPREAWIRRALDTFVKIKYAHKDLKYDDKYHLRYSYARKESMLDIFARKHYEALSKPEKTVEAKQLEFDNFKTIK